MLTELTDVSMYLNQDIAPTTYLVPSTVSDLAQYLSEDLLDEEHNFFETTSDKLATLDTHYTSLESNTSSDYSWESHQIGEQIRTHTEMSESPVDDLLDLDQESWKTDLTDPEWLPEKSPEKRSHKPRAQTSASRPTKRRNTSTTDEEIQIEIEQSTKRAKRCTANLSEEEKKMRRKELNRLAAQRCRNKRKGTAEYLEQEIEELTIKNKDLKEKLEKLTRTKDELYDIIKFHFSSCHGGPNTTQ